MNSMNVYQHVCENHIGSYTDIFSAGAGLFDSFIDARAQRKSDESDERQLQLQLEAQMGAANRELNKFLRRHKHNTFFKLHYIMNTTNLRQKLPNSKNSPFNARLNAKR